MENNVNNELEQMRQQMHMLREKLDKQEIINDKMIRRCVKSKLSFFKRAVYFKIFVIMPFLAFMMLLLKNEYDLSWWYCAFVMTTGTIETILDYRIDISSLKANAVDSNSLRFTMQKLIEMKRMRAISFWTIMPFVIPSLIWMAIEVNGAGSVIGGGIGLMIGFWIAYSGYRRMQRSNDELIAQIKEFSDIE